MKELDLYDVDEGTTIKLIVNEENYNQIVGGNLALATTSVARLKEKQNYLAAYQMVQNEVQNDLSYGNGNDVDCTKKLHEDHSDTARIVEPTTSSRKNEVPRETIKICNSEATKCLISLCQKYEEEFENGIKKFIWNKISREMTEQLSVVYTAQQCDTKFKGSKAMYKQVKNHNKQSGNNHKHWDYYDLMDDLLFGRPEITAKVTCSSSRGLIANGISLIPPKVASGEAEDSEGASATKKSTFSSSFMKKRKNIENAAERHHKEKMARQDRYLAVLDRIAQAVEKRAAE